MTISTAKKAKIQSSNTCRNMLNITNTHTELTPSTDDNEKEKNLDFLSAKKRSSPCEASSSIWRDILKEAAEVEAEVG